MDYLSIPVQLCKYALTEHKVNQLRLFVFLKTKCSGQIKLSDSRIKTYAAELEMTPRTFKNNLNWLLRNNWITFNTKKRQYHLKSFFSLSEELDFQCRKGAIFEPFDFTKFKGFISAAVITYHMKLKGRYDKKRLGLDKRSPRKNRFRRPAIFSLPHTYLANVLDVSKSCARSYRHAAIKDNFIFATHKFQNLGIPIEEIQLYKKYCEENPDSLVELQNKIAIQLNDILTSNIVIRSKSDFRYKRKKKHR